MSSKLTIKDGFQKDRASYKRHDRYKEYLREAAEKALETRFKDYFHGNPCRAVAVRANMDEPVARGPATTDGDHGTSGIGPR